jgi:hypothetical protein
VVFRTDSHHNMGTTNGRDPWETLSEVRYVHVHVEEICTFVHDVYEKS